MKAIQNGKRDGVFETRVGLGLRELDGIEQAPDISAKVLRRLEGQEPATGRSPVRWVTVAAALLAIGVTGTLLVQKNQRKGAEDLLPAAAPQEPAGASAKTNDPVGPWRLVYELPVDELQRTLRNGGSEDLEQLLARSIKNVQTRIGAAAGAKVARGDATTFTVTFENAARGDIARVRSLLENPGKLEMRAVADGDYFADGGAVRFEMAKEREQLQAWLEDGNRARMQRDPSAIANYSASSKHLRWFVHLVRPSADKPGAWGMRYVGLPGMSAVPAHAETDWNDGVIPGDILARPAAEQFLVELVPVNMHEQHFRATDLDPEGLTHTTNYAGGAAVSYRLRAGKTGEYADFSEKYIGKCCALIWNDSVLNAPSFQSRILGEGQISGMSKAEASVMAEILATPLPAPPRLLRSEPGAPR